MRIDEDDWNTGIQQVCSDHTDRREKTKRKKRQHTALAYLEYSDVVDVVDKYEDLPSNRDPLIPFSRKSSLKTQVSRAMPPAARGFQFFLLADGGRCGRWMHCSIVVL